MIGPRQITLSGDEVPHPPPDHTIGGIPLPLPKETQMTDVKETTETTEKLTEKPGETIVEREMEETTEPVTETPADDDGA